MRVMIPAPELLLSFFMPEAYPVILSGALASAYGVIKSCFWRNQMDLTTEISGAIAGFILSWALKLFPGFSTWFNALDGKQKSQVTILSIIATAMVVFVFSCGGIVTAIKLTCTANGVLDLVSSIISVWISSQTTYSTIKKL